MRKFGARPIALVAAIAIAAFAGGCSDDATASAPPATRTPDASIPGNADGGAPDTGTGATTTLYDRLGKKAGISNAVDAIVAEELKDPEVASYFFYQVQTPIPAGHPSAAQIKACLVNQLGNAAGGPEKYPGSPADNLGFQCRDMTTAHTGLNIPPGVFDKFVVIAAGVLKAAKVADADIGTVGTVLNGTKTAVAQDTSRMNGPFIPPDAGGGG